MKELRLFLEGICCDLVRFHHVHTDGVAPETVRIRQEVPLGDREAFADILVEPPAGVPYYVEIKYGHAAERIVRILERKYASLEPRSDGPTRVILVVDLEGRSDWAGNLDKLHAAAGPRVALEIWDEQRVFAMLQAVFGIEIRSWHERDVIDIQVAIDRAKGKHAFGQDFRNDPLQSALLWHFSYWKLKRLYAEAGAARKILPPGLYRNVCVVFADLSSFSSFVRDTRDDTVVRSALTSFYAKTRDQVLATGGMMYQFLGDGVLALFGLPDTTDDAAESALACAKAFVDIGASVSLDWQRQIDHVQRAGGAHVGVALGDLNIVALRPFSRTHISAIADAVNTAARLSSAAGTNEIVASNLFYRALPENQQAGFAEMPPIDARNIGTIRAWKTTHQ